MSALFSLMLYLFSLIPFYLLGATPIGYLIAKSRGVDITQKGSGNVGATNIARTLGTPAGIATLVLDTLKGFIAPLIGYAITQSNTYAAAVSVAAVLGHCFSIPGKLKGGKGVATSLGTLFFIFPLGALVGIGVFAISAWITKIVSLSSIIAACTIFIAAAFVIENSNIMYGVGAIAIIVIARHHENIKRLIEGNEPRFPQRKMKEMRGFFKGINTSIEREDDRV